MSPPGGTVPGVDDLFPELGEIPPAWEVWDSASGNMLLSTADRDEALAEAASVWRAYGEAALGTLSVGCERATFI
jgi:hypothetical protein